MKKGYAKILLIIILGLVFLMLVLAGPGKWAVNFVKEKLFGESLVPRTDEGYVIVPGAVTGVAQLSEIPLKGSTNEALTTLVDKATKCWSEYKRTDREDQLCAKFKPTSSLQGTITEQNFHDALKTAGDTGKDMAGEGGLFDAKNYEWNIGSINSRSSSFVLCADYEFWSTSSGTLYFTRNPSDDCGDAVQE